MALSVQLCSEVLRFDLGGPPGTPVEVMELCNMAGEELVGWAAWRWLEGREARLTPRAPITITGATWTEATKTLTKIGAFASYNFLVGDTYDAQSGTGVNVGLYEIASKTSSDEIVLRMSLGAAANGQTNLAGELPNDQVELPSDFDIQRITAFAATNGLVGALSLTAAQLLLSLRTVVPGVTSVSFWGLLNYVLNSAGGKPIPRLDIWPGPTEMRQEFAIFYRAGWKRPVTDHELLVLPQWLELFYLELLKAIARGQDEADTGSTARRLEELQSSRWFARLKIRDSALQPEYGEIQGGWLGIEGYGSRFNRGQSLADVP